MNGKPTNGKQANGHVWDMDELEDQDWYEAYGDEYDLEEEQQPVEQSLLDVNLVATMIRWVFVARKRVGADRLKDLLVLYLQSSKHSEELKEMIIYICSMAEQEPMGDPDPAQDSIDLLHQLHGILAGGVPVTQILPIKFGEDDKAEKPEGIITSGG